MPPKKEQSYSSSELEVLEILAQGYNTDETASILRMRRADEGVNASNKKITVTRRTIHAHAGNAGNKAHALRTTGAVIDAIEKGFIDPAIATDGMDMEQFNSLTPSEKIVLKALIDTKGGTNTIIAKTIFKSRSAVGQTFVNLYDKVQVRNRTQLVAAFLAYPMAKGSRQMQVVYNR